MSSKGRGPKAKATRTAASAAIRYQFDPTVEHHIHATAAVVAAQIIVDAMTAEPPPVLPPNPVAGSFDRLGADLIRAKMQEAIDDGFLLADSNYRVPGVLVPTVLDALRAIDYSMLRPE